MKKSILTLLGFVPLFVSGQAAVNSSYNEGSIIPGIIIICIALIIFLALRQVVLWYWKIETFLKNQREQTEMLKSIYNSLEETNSLMRSQIELVIGKSDADNIN